MSEEDEKAAALAVSRQILADIVLRPNTPAAAIIGAACAFALIHGREDEKALAAAIEALVTERMKAAVALQRAPAATPTIN